MAYVDLYIGILEEFVTAAEKGHKAYCPEGLTTDYENRKKQWREYSAARRAGHRKISIVGLP